jgi:hypothetical protein
MMSTAPENPEVDDADDAERPPSAQENFRVRLGRELVQKLVEGGCPDDTAAIKLVVSGVLEHAVASRKAYHCDYRDLTNIQLELANRTAELSTLTLELGSLLTDIAGVAEHRAVLFFNREAAARGHRAYEGRGA